MKIVTVLSTVMIIIQKKIEINLKIILNTKKDNQMRKIIAI